MPTPKKFDKPMTRQVNIRLTDEQLAWIAATTQARGFDWQGGSADIIRAALLWGVENMPTQPSSAGAADMPKGIQTSSAGAADFNNLPPGVKHGKT